MTTASPFLTAAPTCFSILKTFPAAPASILTAPAPAEAAFFGAAAGAAAFGAAAGAAAAGAETLPVSSTVTSYAVPLTVIV